MQLIKKQKGFAFGYLMLTLALISLTIYAFAGLANQNASFAWIAKASGSVVSQATLVREQLVACGQSYPNGNNGSSDSLPIYRAYPATPAGGKLQDVLCPGAPADAQAIWSGRNGIFLRKLPNGFSEWAYVNDSTGVYLSTTAESGLASDAMTAIQQQLGGNEIELSGQTLKFWIAR